MLCSSPVPRKIVTDQLRSYAAAKAQIPELAKVEHVLVKAAARLNNRAGNSHQPTRERERRMRGFRDPQRTQLSGVSSLKLPKIRPAHSADAFSCRLSASVLTS